MNEGGSRKGREEGERKGGPNHIGLCKNFVSWAKREKSLQGLSKE